MRGLKETVVTLFVCAFWAHVAEGRIVHTPAAAFAAQAADAVNPCTDENGAVWTAFAAHHANDRSGSRLVSTFMDAGGSVMGYKASTDVDPEDARFPCICVNVGTVPEASLFFAPDVALAPGEIVMHPLSSSGNGVEYQFERDYHAVLRFQVPRTGWYSLDAEFRALTANTTALSRCVDVSVLLDSTFLMRRELVRAGTEEEGMASFSFRHLLLTAGQTLDFAVGPGLSEWSYQCDATTLRLAIVEEDEAAPEIEAVYDLATAFWSEGQKQTPALPFTDPAGQGEWSLYSIGQRYPFHDVNAPTLCENWTLTASMPPTTPWLIVNEPTLTEAVDCGCDPLSTVNDILAPGEFAFHPGKDRAFEVRFQVPEAGAYLVTYAVRDMSAGRPDQRTINDGAKVFLLADGAILADSFVSLEVGPAMDFRQVQTPVLAAGAHLDLVVDNNYRQWIGEDDPPHRCDGTGGFLRIYKLAEPSEGAVYRAGPALAAHVRSGDFTTPFTDGNGAQWAVGQSVGPFGELMPLAATAASSALQGWESGDSVAHSSLPCVYANATGAPIIGGAVQNGQCLYPEEFYIHPDDQGASGVLRFIAPRDGVYAVDLHARDIHPSTGLSANFGVDCMLRTADVFLASDWAAADNGALFNMVSLHPRDVFLKQGEWLDVRVAPVNLRYTNCDATALQETIREQADPPRDIISLDIGPVGGKTAMAGAGRIGWSDQLWCATKVDDAGLLVAETMRRNSTKRTETTFLLARDSGDVQFEAGTGSTLFASGVVSTGTDDVYTFMLRNLQPGEKYGVYLYGAAVDEGVQPAFTLGGRQQTPSLSWTRPYAGEIAYFEGTADAAGCLAGSFASADEGQSIFAGLQITGLFVEYVPRVTVLYFR